jgi:hypothetical protein
MSSNQPDWRSWVQMLQRWGIVRETAAFLEAAGPFRIIIAQLFYFCEPFLHSHSRLVVIDEIGSLLENPAELDKFIALLKEESSQ